MTVVTGQIGAGQPYGASRSSLDGAKRSPVSASSSVAPSSNVLAISAGGSAALHSSHNSVPVPTKAQLETPKEVPRERLSSQEPLDTDLVDIKAPVNIKPLGLGSYSAIEAEIQAQLTEIQAKVTETVDTETAVKAPVQQADTEGAQSQTTAANPQLDALKGVSDAVARASQDSSSQRQQSAYSDAEREVINALKQRDREVRAHEAAHKRAGGQLASSPAYQFSRGPDNIQYAVAGEVSIDTKPVTGDPKATIEKMKTVRKAALAPSSPSSQDRRVAVQADTVIRQSEAELKELQQAEREAARAEAAESKLSEQTASDEGAVTGSASQEGQASDPAKADKSGFNLSAAPSLLPSGRSASFAQDAGVSDISQTSQPSSPAENLALSTYQSASRTADLQSSRPEATIGRVQSVSLVI